MSTVKAGYICRCCGRDCLIDVRERAPEEGIENYVYHVSRMAGEDHSRECPRCSAHEVDIKLPISSNGIGYVGETLTPEELREFKERVQRKDGE